MLSQFTFPFLVAYMLLAKYMQLLTFPEQKKKKKKKKRGYKLAPYQLENKQRTAACCGLAM